MGHIFSGITRVLGALMLVIGLMANDTNSVLAAICLQIMAVSFAIDEKEESK